MFRKSKTLILVLLLLPMLSVFGQNAIEFKGSTSMYGKADDHAALNIAPNESFTFTARIRTTNTNNQVIVAKRQLGGTAIGYEFWQMNGYFAINCTHTDGTSSGVPGGSKYKINDGNWHHIAFVIDIPNKKYFLYVDGKLDTERALDPVKASSGVTNTQPLIIGKRSNETMPFTGELDEMRFYNKALTPEELIADNTSTVTAETEGLKAAWSFETISNNTTPDVKGNCPFILYGNPSIVTVDTSEKIVFDAPFTDNAVIQRDKPIIISGKAAPNDKLTITLDGETKNATADAAGKWSCTFSAKAAKATPFTLEATGENSKSATISNLVCGDIWIASGQSNMEMALVGSNYGATTNGAADAAAANFSNIRFMQPTDLWQQSRQPQSSYSPKSGGWTVCSPSTAGSYSAVAFYFARKLHTDQNVPIGIIQAAIGGTIIEAWTPLDGLKDVPEYEAAYRKATTETLPSANGYNRKNFPTANFNGMIAPFLNIPIKGIIWYQGEENLGMDSPVLDYGNKFVATVNAWRNAWDNPELPVIYTEMANYKWSGWVHGTGIKIESREYLSQFTMEQRKVSQIPYVYGITISDISNYTDIHPANKIDVGERMGNAALAYVYYKNMVAPVAATFKELKNEEDKLRVIFENNAGFYSKDGKAISGFEIAGADRLFKTATATIDGNDVLVSHAEISEPVYVRLGWDENATTNLFNASNSPTSRFVATTSLWDAPGQGSRTVKADRYAISISTEDAIENLNYTATSAPASHYVFDPTQTLSVGEGQTFNLKLEGLANQSDGLQHTQCLIFVDWNRDGVFEDEGEHIATIGNRKQTTPAVLSINQSIAVPMGAHIGEEPTRMRIYYTDAWRPSQFKDNGYDIVDRGRIYDFDIVIGKAISVNTVDANAINVYPNPCEDFLNVTLSDKGTYEISVVSLDGKLLRTKSIVNNNNNETHRLDISSLQPNTYLITVKNSVSEQTFKINKK